MSRVKTLPSVESIVAEIQHLSDEDQRALAAQCCRIETLKPLSKNSKISLVVKGQLRKDPQLICCTNLRSEPHDSNKLNIGNTAFTCPP